jgi:hypothetical protein
LDPTTYVYTKLDKKIRGRYGNKAAVWATESLCSDLRIGHQIYHLF